MRFANGRPGVRQTCPIRRSSPYRDGKLVYLMQRHIIERSTAEQIAGELLRAFDEFCAKATA